MKLMIVIAILCFTVYGYSVYKAVNQPDIQLSQQEQVKAHRADFEQNITAIQQHACPKCRQWNQP